MQGWTVLWVPGTDHAGIATQAVVERWLWQQKGVRRQDLTRSEFMDEVWAWKERHGADILLQLRSLGASLDWTRCAFTMDPVSPTVTPRFLPVLWMSRGLVCGLHRCGLVHRDTRLVNWSCALQSAVADIEVSPRPIPGPTSLRVPGCPHPVTFGVMVTFAYPVEGDDGLELPVSTTRPETMLGDVAVAVSPHRPTYQCGRLGFMVTAYESAYGLCLAAYWAYGGLWPVRAYWHRAYGAYGVLWGMSKDPALTSPPDLALARSHSLPLLNVIGDDGTMRPPGGKGLGVHRFMARDQVVAALAQRGLSYRSGDVIEFLLKSNGSCACREMVLLHSLVRDSMGRKMSKSIGNVIDPRDVIGGATLQELQEKLRRTVLDPHELKVASVGQKRQFPHGIPECGTDALRLALCSHNAHGDDIKLDVAAILKQRHFCNKVWNAVKFVLTFRPHFNPKPPHEVTPSTPMDRWVLSRLAGAVVDYGKKMEALEVHGAMAAMQNFWLRSFCDVYLESIKPSLRRPDPDPTTLQTLLTCTELGLRLLAPFAPFLAEELWHRLPRDPPGPPTLCLAPFPSAAMLAHWICPEVEEEVEAMREVVRTVRALRDVFRLGAARPRVLVQCPAALEAAMLALSPTIQTLSQAATIEICPRGAGQEVRPGWIRATTGTGTHVYVCVQGLVDPDIERTRLQTQILTLQRRLRALPPPQQSQVCSLRSELALLNMALEALGPPPHMEIMGDPPHKEIMGPPHDEEPQ
ncbi:valine--tRNA ligase, mitochondrial-like [Coturnix japonica]|uniref:valine--tRNA ligase, mitochondrial-like n=1 Tax=Coturnix japonica TaxID=93934 RepID=UPI000777346B|nr:valine--tRNA ligase, mitochondrial-like [Coturnix japonica]